MNSTQQALESSLLAATVALSKTVDLRKQIAYKSQREEAEYQESLSIAKLYVNTFKVQLAISEANNLIPDSPILSLFDNKREIQYVYSSVPHERGRLGLQMVNGDSDTPGVVLSIITDGGLSGSSWGQTIHDVLTKFALSEDPTKRSRSEVQSRIPRLVEMIITTVTSLANEKNEELKDTLGAKSES